MKLPRRGTASILTGGITLVSVVMTLPAGEITHRFIAPSRASAYRQCDSSGIRPNRAVADQLIANRYGFRGHETVQLPADLSWQEDPLRDSNWRFEFHSLYWIEDLWFAWLDTRDRSYFDRYIFLLRDWAHDNPKLRPASRYAWNGHATAIRAMVYACAMQRLHPMPSWLIDAARAHIEVLSRESFYVLHGNHALNQSIGLLDLSCVLDDRSGKAVAFQRIKRLVSESVDAQGVSNEQSDGYHRYNYTRYSVAVRHLNACGIDPGHAFDRVRLMPVFSDWATQPDDGSPLIGDTQDTPVTLSRNPPRALFATFGAGYAFFRSAWDGPQATYVVTRFGPPRAFHGHKDGAALTLYSYGRRILIDPAGPYAYDESRYRRWMQYARAHNTVTVEGGRYAGDRWVKLTREAHGSLFDYIELNNPRWVGVGFTRSVVFDRRLNILIVDDRLQASEPQEFHQWWHCAEGSDPIAQPWSFQAGRPGGPSAWVRQLLGPVTQSIYKATEHPVQGWWSPTYGLLRPAPAVSVTKRGTAVRFITLIVPSPDGTEQGTVEGFTVSPDGYRLTLAVGSNVDRISVSNHHVWVRPII